MTTRNNYPTTGTRIGFLTASQTAPAAVRQSPDPAALLQFDGGEFVNFEDARHNCLVLGTTGSGKTASIILPAAERLIAAGFGGLIVDIKGNFTGQIRAIARAHGRCSSSCCAARRRMITTGPFTCAACVASSMPWSCCA